MKSQYLRRHPLPEGPGIYIFRNSSKKPIYIGRATSLCDRTKSYFANDLIRTRGPRIVDMVTKAASLTWKETSSVLEAILLESAEIKKYQPFYNVAERDDKSDQYVVITDELWPRVFQVRARDYEAARKEGILPYKVKRIFGPFPQATVIKDALRILRRLFPFRDRKAVDPRHEAFYKALGVSPQTETEDARKFYMRTISRLILFFEGKRDILRHSLERDMKRFARDMRFEEANQAKKLLYALDHINDVSLVKAERQNTDRHEFRIEAYDIAHLSGTDTVGTMVASVNGEFMPAEYRMFKMAKDSNNDTANLTETLFRRLNHSEWTYPDLIVVDGNEVQLRHAEKVLQVRRIMIPVVAVTKDARHKAAAVIGDPELVARHQKAIIALNAECHRFTIRYHRKRRSVGLRKSFGA